MDDIVIKAEKLGKKYTIGHQAQRGGYVALRDVIAQNVRGFWNKTRDLMQGKPIIQGDQQEEIWALKDVNFEVKQGEAIGIIGRNGAGKSTLLKVLSRITEPSVGRVTIKGRVASLLEVGTGFHPELTGRENIYLNGAILGMSRQEIKKKFDEIVAFAEIEKFLDTPVKRFSSGMYVRLAFAIAAHLDPEILLVDEVLAVGDAEFQKKCLGKMDEVAKGGRTILFVSHNMGMMSNLCSKAFLLNKGLIVKEGHMEEVVSYYMKYVSTASNTDKSYKIKDSEKITKDMYIFEANTIDDSSNVVSNYKIYDPVILNINLKINKYLQDVVLGITVKDHHGRKIFTNQRPLSSFELKKSNNNIVFLVQIPAKILVPGTYSFMIGLHIPKIQIIDLLEDVCMFNIIDTGSELSMYEGSDYGCVFANCEWKLRI